ncbi:MAG TPA: septal ring lytic transglycosylase RlpA family protein [Candidatus Acidoferrales bacterium]|jgi:rare lipoprotein A (peptidoglycan hydrolase)|nr:septal ring lytic transglycosylase RlpA family protein [Candidatus Acidoferrales bacterium]
MRNKLAVIKGSLVCILLAFALTPTLDAPLKARAISGVAPIKVWYGTASWYGPTFQGRTTASGELYDMTAYTAAHPTLPFGSMVRLINPRSGRSAVVRINDRGPYVHGRDIDVSYQVAERLRLIDHGVVRLRMELIQLPKEANKHQ